MEAMFRAPLENIFGVRRPFLVRKEAGFTLLKRSTERASEIADRLGAVEQTINPRPVSPGIAVRDVLREPRAPLVQLLEKE